LNSKFQWRPFGWNNLRASFTGSQAEQERRELRALFERVKEAYEASSYGQEFAVIDFIDALVAEAARRADITLPEDFATGVKEFVYSVTQEDPVMFWMPVFPDNLTIETTTSLRTILSAKERFLSDPERYEDVWSEKVIRILEGFFGYLPPLSPNGQFAVSVLDVCKVPEVVERLMATMYDDDVVSTNLFDGIRAQFERNLVAASGLSFEEARRRPNAITRPTETKLPPGEIVSSYLYGTAFTQLFSLAVPFAIPEHTRFEHTHILAGSGHGKTQTLQHLILADLQRTEQPGLVIIDSQGDMIRNVSKLALFEGPLKDKIIIIDPRDVEHPPALNMFDVNLERIGRYGAADREQILNGVIELYEYFFGSLLGAELTQKQTLIFRYLARLMIHIPAATIRTLIELMDSTKPYQHIIDALPESARMFFDKEFADRSYNDTKTQIKRRLYGIIENQTFERMFSAPKNKIDIPTALNEGKIVLVNTAKDFLKGGSSILGRYFIALTLQAALERAAIPESQRRPAFLYIDEAAEYFDNNIDNLLNQARKYKLGMVMAHQYLDQLAGGLRASIASNTSVKFAGGVSDRDARSVAPDMRTTPSFILEQHKGTKNTHFACYLRNITPAALSLTVPFGTMEREPTMSSEAYSRLLDTNRARVSDMPPTDTPQPTGPNEPIISLHRPDLPWKLESGPGEMNTDSAPEW
jgi:hypothetical protein